MIIISKYKDFYDYLTHIYGVDDKIILDRRTKNSYSFQFYESESKKLTFHICGMSYDGVWHNGRFYWGEDLKQLDTRNQELIDHIINQNRYVDIIFQERSLGTTNYKGKVTVQIYPYEDKTNSNIKENCPILIDQGGYNGKYPFPRLDQFKFNQALPPQEIYLMLTAWLSPKDVETTPMTDKQKIVSAGFDLKTSFRGK